MYLNYFVNKETKDIIKGIKVGDIITGYIKYKKVSYKTERKNSDGDYILYSYPFESYEKWPTEDKVFFEPFNLFLPKLTNKDVSEISQTEKLKERWGEKSTQMVLVRKMFSIFKEFVAGFDDEKMGLDSSLQCGLETKTSDIDLVVKDAALYQNLYSFISNSDIFTMFSTNAVQRRGAYSSFMTTRELEYFEGRKLSFIFEGTKVSILFSDTISLPEELVSTGSLIFIRSRPGINKSVGEPSMIELHEPEIIYGPRLNASKKIYYLSVLPVRTGFILKKEDTLYITGIIYLGKTTGNVFVSQFIWDYCPLFNTHNIALNTYIRVDDGDKRIVGRFFDNLKL